MDGEDKRLEIVFETREEAAGLYRELPAVFRQASGVLLINSSLVIVSENDEDYRELANLTARHIIEQLERNWLLEMIEKHYFFTDPAEKIAILSIVQAIFAGEKKDLPQAGTLPDRRELMVGALNEIFQERRTFTYSSFLRFRLTAYRNVLRRFVEIAIDEYKLEQEYQVFIDKLRRIIRSYRPLCNRIEVFDEQPFRLYDDRHRLVRNDQSVRSFYPLLKQWGIEAEPSIILTLIALAPQQVIVHTDRPEHSIMRTLHQVFEDRVCFLPSSFHAKDQAGYP
jgi:putative sporulation protein YtxC